MHDFVVDVQCIRATLPTTYLTIRRGLPRLATWCLILLPVPSYEHGIMKQEGITYLAGLSTSIHIQSTLDTNTLGG